MLYSQQTERKRERNVKHSNHQNEIKSYNKRHLYIRCSLRLVAAYFIINYTTGIIGQFVNEIFGCIKLLNDID